MMPDPSPTPAARFEAWCDTNGYAGKAHLENMQEMKRALLAGFSQGRAQGLREAAEWAKEKAFLHCRKAQDVERPAIERQYEDEAEMALRALATEVSRRAAEVEGGTG